MDKGEHRRVWRFLRSLGALALCLAVPFTARAADYTLTGFADLRLVQPSNQRSWMEGGLGKLRFNGGSDTTASGQLAEIAADGKAQLTPQLAVLGTLRYDPDQFTPIDLLEGYARYRPVANTTWQWTNKFGAFFPPISLENEGVAWTSPWTLTPSAINTWVGEELRTIGGETGAEWRFNGGAVGATGAVFGWSGPTGTLIANRGWALGDSQTGLFDKVRLPDVVANREGDDTPYVYEPFLQIGSSPGWYAGLSARADGLGRLRVLYYDNRADPSAMRHDQIGWHTRFTSAGAELDLGPFVVLSQAIAGSTEIDPTPAFRSITKFQSAYLLVGRYFGDVTVAGRLEVFGTSAIHSATGPNTGEHGHAATFAVSWRPIHWLKFTAEALRADSYRADRIAAGLAPRASENQLQFSARAYF